MDWLFDFIEPVQIWLFQEWVLPVVYSTGSMSWADEAFDATGLFLLALCQIFLIYLVLKPLEIWRPVEQVRDNHAIRTDVLYTFLYRTGALSLLFFFLLTPVIGYLEEHTHRWGLTPLNIEDLFPFLNQTPALTFLIYLVIIDFFEYWRHRWQHKYDWWWALHALHHSQRQMTLWTDDRNHIIDGLLQSLWMALIAQLIGVPANQFIGIVFLVQAVESLSHCNARLHFGAVGNRLLVSPFYHRIHHGLGIGHEGKHQGVNFATLLPVWDWLFGTAEFGIKYPATGIRDQESGANYGTGLLQQQWFGILRLFGKFSQNRIDGIT